MKNLISVLLLAALLGCTIWGCTLTNENRGITLEKTELARKYSVLQTLYVQAQEDMKQAEETHAAEKLALRAQTAQWQEALKQAQAAYHITANALREAAGLPVPETEETVAPAPETTPEEAPAPETDDQPDDAGIAPLAVEPEEETADEQPALFAAPEIIMEETVSVTPIEPEETTEETTEEAEEAVDPYAFSPEDEDEIPLG
ncbi:MAG: hypothetical protein IJ189_04570 [Clostridia bacterium]|nr:hypothetical protein [Clostridia bacterium]